MAAHDPGGARLDRAAWVDPAVLERERRRVFATAWLCLATVDRLAVPGGCVATWMGNRPILVLQRRGGPVAFVDRCPCCERPLHLSPRGIEGSLACAAHGAVEGNAERVPSLAPRGGLLFASFDPDPLPLADWLGGLAPWLDRALGAGLQAAGSVPLPWSFDGNWKLPVERSCEAGGDEVVVAGPGVCVRRGGSLRSVTVFPNLCLDLAHHSLHVWHPATAVRTRVETTAIVRRDATAAERRQARHAAMLAWGPLGGETQALAPAWQSITAAAAGPLARRVPLPLLAHERGPRAFHAWWVERLQATNERPAPSEALRLTG